MPLKSIGVEVEGTFTDIVLGNYENKLLIVVTQTRKFGSILRIEKEIFQALDGQENVFSIQTIFGKEDDQVSLFARILCERIETTKPIILIANLKVLISELYLAAMTIFGQLVIGPPGSGKSTYCREMRQFLTDRGRKVAIVNFDPANDSLPYAADIDVSEYTTADDVMNFLHVGPNCAVLYCMEFLERCAQKIVTEIEKKKDRYFLIDCPGQVELYTHHQSLKNILAFFESIDLRLCCIHLVDSHYCSDAGKFISTLLLSLSAMLHIGLPHLNVLSKMDLLRKFESKLSFTLDYYTDVLDLSYLIECLDQDAITSKHKKLNQTLASFIEAYGLVHFTPLNVFDTNTLSNVRDLADKANGYVFNSCEERNVFKLLSVATSSTASVHRGDDQCAADRPENTLFNYTMENVD